MLFYIIWKPDILIWCTEKPPVLKTHSGLSRFEYLTTDTFLCELWSIFPTYMARAATDLSSTAFTSYTVASCDTKHYAWRIKELHYLTYIWYLTVKTADCWANQRGTGKEKSTWTEIRYMCQLCSISAHAHTFKSRVGCSSLTTGTLSQFTSCLSCGTGRTSEEFLHRSW